MYFQGYILQLIEVLRHNCSSQGYIKLVVKYIINEILDAAIFILFEVSTLSSIKIESVSMDYTSVDCVFLSLSTRLDVPKIVGYH